MRSMAFPPQVLPAARRARSAAFRRPWRAAPALRMIIAITIINNFGKCRFMKLYREHMVRSASCTLPARQLRADHSSCRRHRPSSSSRS